MHEKIILWVDDEVESLKSLIIFLNDKGFQILTCSNGFDALDIIKETKVDLVLLDESMPGITGLETLNQIKVIDNSIPVVMVTKNEEEYIMEEAIGSQISDYLIKPVNPNQVWLSLKKQFESKRLVSEKVNHQYQQEFRTLFMALNENPGTEEWKDIYKNIIKWEMELGEKTEMEMIEVIQNQKKEANTEFSKYVIKNYSNWIKQNGDDIPLLSHNLLKEVFFTKLSKDTPTLLLLLDNLRFDHWLVLKPMIEELFTIESEDMYFGILPTSTQYARNAIFSGLLPKEIANRYPDLWSFDDEEGGKNLHEEKFFKDHLEREGLNFKTRYDKITNHDSAKKLEDHCFDLLHNDVNILVYNFIDFLSHARSEMEIMKELASNDFAYRSLMKSWFIHSPIYNILKKLSTKKINILLTTDHGNIQVKSACKVKGTKAATANLRYKHGKTLDFNNKDVFVIHNPNDVGLPFPEINSKYIFAKEDNFLCYPNNFGYYSNYFYDSFQHGGVSLEEMLIPCVFLKYK